MPSAEQVQPESVGLSSHRLDTALALLRGSVDSGAVPAASTAVARKGHLVCVETYGRGTLGDRRAPLDNNAIFLLASLTKPVVCSGVMILVQEGRLGLDQPVADLVPEFGKHGKDKVRVRHLLTHTSGLPDQLANNVELRVRHAPLSDFVASVCDLELLFEPGMRVSYQSMGILMLQEIVERVTGARLRNWLDDHLFAPLGMSDTILGVPKRGIDRTVVASASGDPNYGSEETDWGWNSAYWRDLGAPWGGLHSTAKDLATFLAHMLGRHAGPLSQAARRAMVRDQTATMANIPTEQRLANRWGLGWSLGSPSFGSLVSRDTFGHTGATGTLFWADPETEMACVLLTNRPDPGPALFARYSNAVASAVEG
jgi:CubicO group peptidase (beta-lactamase class C family)